MSLYSWGNTKHESLLRTSVLVGIGIGEDWGPHREHLPRRLLTETCAPCSLQDNHSPAKSSPYSGSPPGTLLYVMGVSHLAKCYHLHHFQMLWDFHRKGPSEHTTLILALSPLTHRDGRISTTASHSAQLMLAITVMFRTHLETHRANAFVLLSHRPRIQLYFPEK